jgi:ankyrin repeat protein
MKTLHILLAVSATAVTVFAQSKQDPAKTLSSIEVEAVAQQMQIAVMWNPDLYKVEEFIKRGFDINSPIGCGTFNSLDGAVSTHNLDMFTFLVSHGAKPQAHNLTDAAFISDPHIAFEMVKILLSMGVDPNGKDLSNATPLSRAAYRGNLELVNLLLAQPKIAVNAADGDGCTALMCAAEHGSLEIVASLLKAGADPHLANKRGETANAMINKEIPTRDAIVAALDFARK